MLFDILTIGGYTDIRRFWREYLRTPCGGEGGCADYLLFFYIKKVIQIRFSICIIAEQECPAVDSIVVYGLFCVQNRNRELRIIPIPSILCVVISLCMPSRSVRC